VVRGVVPDEPRGWAAGPAGARGAMSVMMTVERLSARQARATVPSGFQG
jgi:hypothetical protein